jgi:ubiquinone/menaquinone biosynthesis C-methylase UbiE
MRFIILLLLSMNFVVSAQDSSQVLLERTLSPAFGAKVKGTIYESRIKSIQEQALANLQLKKQIDSLRQFLTPQYKVKSADSLLFSQLLLSAVNDSSGDTYAMLRKAPSEKALALNRIVPLSKLYEIDRKYAANHKSIAPILWSRGIKREYEAPQKEISSMNLKSGTTIADLGAGDGIFEYGLDKSLSNLTVYATEVDTSKFNVLCDELLKLQLQDNTSNRFIPIYGTSTNTGLPDRSCDAIVIRNAFHHFDHPQEMLQDIKRKLKKNGTLYILDIMVDEITNKPACDKHLTRAVFLANFPTNDFKLIEELTLPGRDFKVFAFRVK